jgi:hypothetical protein
MVTELYKKYNWVQITVTSPAAAIYVIITIISDLITTSIYYVYGVKFWNIED